MAVQRRHPRSTHDASADQLTLADWEREQVLDGLRATDPAEHAPTSRPSARFSVAPESNPEPPPPSTTEVEGAEARRSRTRATIGDGLETRQLLTVSEVAKATGLSANAIYRAISSGELRASKLRGQLRIQSSDVEAWVDATRVPAQAADQAVRRPGPTLRASPGPAEACASSCKPPPQLQGDQADSAPCSLSLRKEVIQE
jgi:excisionase family DNA binding protein